MQHKNFYKRIKVEETGGEILPFYQLSHILGKINLLIHACTEHNLLSIYILSSTEVEDGDSEVSKRQTKTIAKYIY